MLDILYLTSFHVRYVFIILDFNPLGGRSAGDPEITFAKHILFVSLTHICKLNESNYSCSYYAGKHYSTVKFCASVLMKCDRKSLF